MYKHDSFRLLREKVRCLSRTGPSSTASRIGDDSKARQCGKFLRPHKTQHSVPSASKETVVNLRGKPLDDAVYSALLKRLKYAAAPTVLHIEDILTWVEKAIKSLPVEAAEIARQETEDYQGHF
jgi:hypothetical protein